MNNHTGLVAESCKLYQRRLPSLLKKAIMVFRDMVCLEEKSEKYAESYLVLLIDIEPFLQQ